MERLEDRTLLAVQDLGPLRFSADSFTTDGGMVSADGTIELGLTPTGIEAFKPLVQIDGKLSFAVTMTNQMFMIEDASLSSIVSGSTIPLLESATRDFAVTGLIGNGSRLSGGQTVPVAGVGFTPDTIKLDNPGGPSTSDARVALQGDIAIPDLKELSLPVAGMNFVFINDTGVSLTGVAVASQQFDAFGLTVKTSDLKVAFSNNNGMETFAFTGSVTVSDDDVSFTGSLGNATTPGLVVADGVVTQIDIGISASIKVAALSINANGLDFSYNWSFAKSG